MFVFPSVHPWYSNAYEHGWQRGLHDVRDEIRFPSRPGFVFHDSCGFEAGSVEELATVRRFVEDSSTTTDVKKQLHAIWCARYFCLYMVTCLKNR